MVQPQSHYKALSKYFSRKNELKKKIYYTAYVMRNLNWINAPKMFCFLIFPSVLIIGFYHISFPFEWNQIQIEQ